MRRIGYMTVLLLTACQAGPGDGSVRYTCGNYRAEINSGAGTGTVSSGKNTVEVVAVPAASGVKLASKDLKTAFWEKGGEATLFLGEKEIIPCVSEQEKILMEGLIEKQRQQERLDIYRLQNRANALIRR